MKNITKTKSYVGTLAIVFFAIFGVSMVSADTANTAFNTDPQDRATVRVSNYTQNPGSTACWSTAIPGTSPQTGCNNQTLQAGDLVSVAIYYHNTGSAFADNTRVKLNSPSGTSTSHSFSGGVLANNASYKSGSSTVNISSAQSLTYQSCFWYPNQTQAAQNCPNSGQDVFTSSGLSIGNVAPGWASQGSVVIRFRVSNNTTPPPSTYECNDGQDNDGDGDTDYPADNGCTSSSDNSENSDGNNNGGASPDVDTRPATDVNKYTARMNGFIDANNTYAYYWFEYGENSFSSRTADTSAAYGSSYTTFYLTGLNDGTEYKYQLCAKNSNTSRVCGGVEYFTTIDDGGNGGGGSSDDHPDVTTLSADDIDEDSATLQGEADPNGDALTQVWFEYGEDEDDLDETTYVSSSDYDDNEDEDTVDFDKKITGLDEDTKYYFRACAENSEGEDCGSIRSFTTDEDGGNNNDDENNEPSVSTTPATSVGTTYARLNGIVDTGNDDDTQAWFEWGTNTSTSFDTNKIDAIDASRIGDDTYAYGITITNLSPNTLYYFRAIAENDEGDDTGSIYSFRTLPESTPVQPTIVYNTIVSGGSGTGQSLIMLEIESRDSTVTPGDRISYTVRYENISGKELRDTVLNIKFPNDIDFIDSDEGEYSVRDNELTLDLGTLSPGESDEFDIEVRVSQDATIGDLLTTSATMAFTTPSGAQEDAVAYALHDVVRGSSLAGLALFGFDGFFPSSLIGWLILILLVVAIVVITRRAFRPRV
ncbi:MAG: hypothetical protein KBC42_03380 [Candidatus Pacebacteria bacterium]|nr:hypothetical protein [Candidatus Paceibacterota bacterium]MBP9780939.1 hypothetical protein [Candidatus Paceibacterota bacterium]